LLITEEYRKQNEQLHADPVYGVSAVAWVGRVRDLCAALKTTDVLDYGCGKRTLRKGLGWDIACYDPCIPECSSRPEPHDVVACIDVLEHIEPDCLDAVLDDLRRVTKKAAFLLIANRPARKVLPDGRNAHLIQEGPDFWLPKLWARFEISLFHEVEAEGKRVGYVVVVRKKGD
jgi:hypothetical protein